MNPCAASIGSLSGMIAFVAFLALMGFALMGMALRGAHEKIAGQQEVIGSYRSKEDETLAVYRG